MKITLSINSKESIEIGHSDSAFIIGCLPDDLPHAIFFAKLATHPASEVRSAVAAMSFMDTDMLEQLARDTSIEVVRQVANNKRVLRMFKNSMLLEMIARDVSVAAEIAENLSGVLDEMREEIIQALLQHADPKVVETTESFVRRTEEIWEDDPIEVDDPD